MMSAALAFLCVSCETVRQWSDRERAESFEAFEELKVGSKTMREFALMRTSGLIGGVKGGEGDFSADAVVAFNSTQSGELEFGTAVAVDRRGYLVTAAHCVDGDKEVTLLLSDPSSLTVRKPRIVYTGDPAGYNSDFAILHVSERLPHVFEWASVPASGDEVISTGMSRVSDSDQSGEVDLKFVIEPVGGRIRRTWQQESEGEGAPYQIILHDAPLKYGNSGGPLLDRQGRLLGVNVTGAVSIPIFYPGRFRWANAVRPDLDWLKQVIEEDAKSLKRGIRSSR